MIKLDLVGQEFGRLIVLKKMPNINNRTCWLCLCNCGKKCTVRTNDLKKGNTKSCGCLSIEKDTTHGLRKHLLYIKWVSMKARCYNPKATQYEHWGGRGITVCSQWKNNFKVFFDWCIANGWRKGLEIDRRENDENYEPDNCRFVTRRKNSLNRRLIRSNNTSGYEGVHMATYYNKWISMICIKGRRILIGSFIDKKDAVKARNNYIIEHNIQHEYKVQVA